MCALFFPKKFLCRLLSEWKQWWNILTMKMSLFVKVKPQKHERNSFHKVTAAALAKPKVQHCTILPSNDSSNIFLRDLFATSQHKYRISSRAPKWLYCAEAIPLLDELMIKSALVLHFDNTPRYVISYLNLNQFQRTHTHSIEKYGIKAHST